MPGMRDVHHINRNGNPVRSVPSVLKHTFLEAPMRKLILIAAMLMASASAHAGGFSFKVEGQQVRINVPRGCSSLSCINVSAPGLTDKLKDKELDTASTPAPATTATAPAAAPAPAPVPAPAPQVAAPAPDPAPAPQISSKVTVLTAPDAASTQAPSLSAPPVTAPEASVQPAPAPAPAPVQVAAASAPATAPAPAPAAVQTASTPLGVWLSEKKEGKIRIEDCNGDLCGYAVDAKTGANGAKVLINMKARGDKWAGRIKDTRSGGIYDSTIALRGSDKLKVQGCAFGGMFCGGETWTRVE
jgi:uncharacterized protein (DUF2147 family)